MSNHDVQVSGSQSAATTVLAAELESTHQNGQVELALYVAKWAGQNTGHKLYPAA